MLDRSWVDAVRASPGPHLFVAEAVLLYFEADQVEDVFRLIADSFPGSLLAVDTGSEVMAADVNDNDVLRGMGARMTWICADPVDLERLGVRLVESRTFGEPQPELRDRMPLRFRVLWAVMRSLLRRAVPSYHLNLVQFPARSEGAE